MFEELLQSLFSDEAEPEQEGEALEAEEEEAVEAFADEDEEEERGEAEDEEFAVNEDELRMYGIEDLDRETQKQLLPYLKKMSANFNKLHQKTIEKLKEYEAFGTPEDVKAAVELVRLASESPQEFVEAMKEYGLITEDEAQEILGEGDLEGQPAITEETLEAVKSGLEELHQKYGDFDDRMLLSFLDVKTLNFEEAYKEMVKEAFKVANKIGAYAPTIPSVGSAVAGDKRLPKNIDEATRLAYEYLVKNK